MSIEIPLTQGKVAIVSDEDADLALLNWYFWHHAHPRTLKFYDCAMRMDYSGVSPKAQKLQRCVLERILGRPLVTSERAEYLDGNPLNCQRENIRYSTSSKRQQKEILRADNASGFRGVYFQKDVQSWHAQIHQGGIQRYLGLYGTAEEAALAYDRAASEMFGKDAKLNFPQPQPVILTIDGTALARVIMPYLRGDK